MKRRMLGLRLMTMILVWLSSAAAMSPNPGVPSIRLDGKLNYPCIGSDGGTAYLQVSVVTTSQPIPDRPHLNLAVVLDRSGSMAEEGKMQNAKAALRALIDQLDDDDIFSLVIYDDVVDVIRPAARVGSKQQLKCLVDEVYPRGWTNLGAGMLEGYAQVTHYARPRLTNRVVLLSDGLANRGITDLSELSGIARSYRNRSISLTTMGVGLDYNENLMLALSECGGGNYYFIESARNIAAVMQSEFRRLSCVLAQNACIHFSLGHDVRVIDIIGAEGRSVTDRYDIPVGDLYAGQRREFTVVLDIPPGSGTMTVVSGWLTYESEMAGFGHPTFAAKVRYTRDLAERDRNRDMDIQAKGDIALSTRGVERAMKALDAGRPEEAAAAIAGAKDVLSASPAMGSDAGAVIRVQSLKLDEYKATVNNRSIDGRKVKKSIQYDNYRTQQQQ